MINKSTLTSVISKYYLNGLNNQVKWRIKDNQLTIYAGESGRVCKIEHSNFPLEDAELGVFDTHKLSKLISITNGDLMVSLEKIKAVGFSGLSNEEQSKLYEASKKMSKDSARD